MPTIRERLQFIVAGVAGKEPPRSLVVVKEAPFQWPASTRDKPQWTLLNYENYVKDGYELNALIYSAISYKARAVAWSPLKAFIGDPADLDPAPLDHPLSQLLARPNAHQSYVEFQALNTTYLNLSGNSYTVIDRSGPGGVPIALYPLRPDRVRFVPQGSGISGYVYVPEGRAVDEGVPILPSDMMHVKLPNPGDRFEGFGPGLSPMAALAQSGDVDNSVTTFLKKFFEHGTMPMGTLETDDPLEPGVAARIRERWHETYGGSRKWSDVAVLDSGTKYKQTTPTFDEMGFEVIDERSESRILGPFGVPPILIGTRLGLKHATYSNAEEARRAFWLDTFVAELKLFEAEYAFALQTGDAFVQFDFSKVPALTEDASAQVDSANKLWQMGVPAKLALAQVGIRMPDFDGAEQAYVPLQMIPVGAPRPDFAGGTIDDVGEPPADEPSTTGESQPVEEDAALDRTAFWKAFDTTAQSFEEPFRDMAIKRFDKEQRIILARFKAVFDKARTNKQTVDYSELKAVVDEFYALEASDEWSKDFDPLLKAVVKKQVSALAGAFQAFDVIEIVGLAWYDQFVDAFADDIVGVSRRDLGRMVKQASDEAWTNTTIIERTTQVFDVWAGREEYEALDWAVDPLMSVRAELIARTETIRIANAAAQQEYREWGVKENEWLSTRDDRVRDSHAAADGQIAFIGSTFLVGGARLHYPGDPAGPAREVVGCRCTIIPVLK